MCGIAGYIGKKNISISKIRDTMNVMKNRGPDFQDWCSFKHNETNIYLFHSRLSIIDLDVRSNQPFKFNNYTIVFNGEIYNYIEVRTKLEKIGHKFSTDSDTEVLLKAYVEYGEQCVNYFNGMWAFAIWDDKNKFLFLSRDRFGEKPLYYHNTNNEFYFASEVKAIQSLLDYKLKINYNHIKRYLVYGYKFLNKTKNNFFKDVDEVEYANNILINTEGEIIKSKFWKPKSNIEKLSLNDAIDGVKKHLIQSVKLRLRSDVPLAFCLSGGVDSASLASIAKKEFGYDVTAFSIIDQDERYNELDNINATVKDLNCKSHLVHLDYKNMIDRLESLVEYHDSPISTISYLVHSMLSEQISQSGFKVSVSGTSGDELFTGYYDHFNLHLYEMRNEPNFKKYLDDWQSNIGNFVRNPYLKNPKLYFDDQSIRDHNHLNSELFASYLKEDYSITYDDENFTGSLLRNRMLNELFHEITPVILHEDDLNSMYYSIENRSPYLDYKLFEFAYSIPAKYLINNGYGKYILRKAVKGILNDKVRLDRKKLGFNASINSVIDINNNRTKEFLLSDGPIFDLVDKGKIEKFIENKFFENSHKKFLFNFINSKIFLDKN